MASSPSYAATPKVGTGTLSSANSNLDGSTGDYVDILDPGTNGSRINWVSVKALATTTAGMVRLFLDDGSGNTPLIREVAVDAITQDATTKTFAEELDYTDRPIVLPNGTKLKAATENAENFAVVAFGADL